MAVEGPFLDSRLKVSGFNGVPLFEGFDTRFGYELEGVIEVASRSRVQFLWLGFGGDCSWFKPFRNEVAKAFMYVS